MNINARFAERTPSPYEPGPSGNDKPGCMVGAINGILFAVPFWGALVAVLWWLA